MYKWNISPLILPLKFDWAISRNTSKEKENFLICVEDEESKGMGEIAFNVRYEESKSKILDQMNWFLEQDVSNIRDWIQFDSWLDAQKNLCSSLKMGLSQAFVSFKADQTNQSINEIFNNSEMESAETSFSIPLVEKNDLLLFLDTYELRNYSRLKLKIKNYSSIKTLNTLLELYPGLVRIDANEGFENAKEFLNFFDEVIDPSRIEFIEQPLPANKNLETKIIKNHIDIPLIADESITSQVGFDELAECFDGVNIKLMKSGTLSRAIEQLKLAKKFKMKTMLGCMIETSLSISFAYRLGENIDYLDLDGFLLISKDPFNMLNEKNGKLRLSTP